MLIAHFWWINFLKNETNTVVNMFTIFTLPIKHLVYPPKFCISKLSSISLMMTAYSQEKLKTILMQNFRGKHVNTVLWTMWNKSSEWSGALSGSKWKWYTLRYEFKIICCLSLNSLNFWIVNESYNRASLHHRNICKTPSFFLT